MRLRPFFIFLIVLSLLPYILGGGNLIKDQSFSQVVTDAKGKALRLSLSDDDKYRIYTKLEDIPSQFVDLLLLKEDKYFYYHPGFNPYSLLRSFFNTFLFNRSVSGASTLTMQLARVKYGIQSKSVLGKLKQILYAYGLELYLTKEQILESYINLAPYGRNIEGIEAASWIYFKKSAKNLSLHESSLLAVVPQRPYLLNGHHLFAPIHKTLQKEKESLFKKYSKRYVKQAKFKKMVHNKHYIYGIGNIEFLAPHLTTSLILRDKNKHLPEIKTNLDLRIQKLLEEKIQTFIQLNKSKNIENASTVIIDYVNMQVVAYVGSADYFNSKISGQVDGILSARSPGSTLKPFVYALALEQGLIHPMTMLLDAPQSYQVPENFDYSYKGPISATEALIASRNIPAVILSAKVNKPDLYDFLKQTDVHIPHQKAHYGDGIVMGGLELTPLKLAHLYTILGNDGVYKGLDLINPKAGDKRVFNRETNSMLMSMLKQNPRPNFESKYNFVKKDHEVYWKTGTSIGFRDAWSAGIYKNFAIVSWTGNFNGKANPYFVGSLTAAPLFFSIVDALKPYSNEKRYYENLEIGKLNSVEVCPSSGHLPNKHCPKRTKTMFYPGVSPIKKCQVHRELHVDLKNNLQLCENSKRVGTRKVFEVWSNQILSIYKKIGIARKAPPKYAPECHIGQQNHQGIAPKIISPKSSVKYSLRLSDNRRKIKFEARSDSNVKTLYWYLGKNYIGKTKSDEILFWDARPGKYHVRLVDDKGRSASKLLNVSLIQ